MVRGITTHKFKDACIVQNHVIEISINMVARCATSKILTQKFYLPKFNLTGPLGPRNYANFQET